MSKIYCSSCGKEHTINNRYCSSCGEDLEEIILDYKKKLLPIAFDNDKPKKSQPVDKWEERRQTVLKIKEQEKARERIAKLEEQQRIAEYEKTRKRRKVPSRKTFWIVLALFILSFVSTLASIFLSFNYDFAFITIIIFGVLTFVFLFAFLMINSLIKTKGLYLCYVEQGRRGRRALSQRTCWDWV
ncbi:MAG: zinc-ribbon domain-containing protein, partial [Candidatus Heimdallarchaeota archaeon]|nr:zinc-ribbon domain-containing protein [Candidatus Heimdallarchaeota archaeon]MCK4878214.1 zinc-ribbon domain-containing protein [Candidatus Heimdallarchaeota archaeon]